MKTRRNLLLLTGLLLIASSVAMAQDFKKGVLYYNDGNHVLAKKYLLKELNGPDKDQAYYLIGKTYQQESMPDSAAYYFQKGMDVNPNNAFAYVGLGEVALSNGNVKGAEGYFSKARSISSEKKNPALWVALYLAYINQNNPNMNAANEYLDKAKSINKSFAGIYMAEGDYLMKQGKIGDAATKYETAIYYDNNSKEALLKLGRIYVKSGNYAQSLETFNKLYALDGSYFPVFKEIGEVYYAQGKFADASKSYAEFFAAAEPSYNDLVRYALILFFNKDYPKSLEILKQAQAINPNNPVANRVLAYNFFQTNDYLNGVKAMQQFFANTKPEDIIQSDYEYYARLLSRTNNDSLAVQFFEKATTPKNRNAMNREIENCYEKMKRFDKIAELYETNNEGKDNVSSQTYLDWAKANYFASTKAGIDSISKEKYLAKSDSLYGIFITKNPDNYLGYIWRARINALLDPESTKALAKPYYEKVVTILEPEGEHKKELVEAYLYLGYQFYLAKDKENAKNLFSKVLILDPANTQAKAAIDGIK